MDVFTNKTWTEAQTPLNPILTINTTAALVAAFVIALVFGAKFLTFSQYGGGTLEITQLYIYPVKGIRGCALQEAHLGKYGFNGDRTFSLQKVNRDKEDESKKTYETMLIGYHLQLSLFQASVQFNEKKENASNGEVVVKWHGRCTDFGTAAKDTTIDVDDEIRFPLVPSTNGRKEFDVSIHNSPTRAYDMGDELASWFSDRLGFETRLAYIGDQSRAVLGSLAPNSQAALKGARLIKRLRSLVPFLAYPEERIAFNDLAHYLVVTEESNTHVSSRLEGNLDMDIRKFRPNIVVKNASGPFVEDFWGELTFDGGVQMPLTANCYRCQSITVDFETGRAATDDRGLVWKKLNKDRRVDKGAKYSPVFGRYGFCFGSAVGRTLRIGQKAQVTRINPSRTTFDWPHLTTFGLGQTKTPSS